MATTVDGDFEEEPTSAEVESVGVLGRGLRARSGINLSLRTVRDAIGRTQIEVARDSQMHQADISRLEQRSDLDDCQVATLRRYVEALGGQLELVARFGNRQIALVGTSPPAVQDSGPVGERPRARRAKRGSTGGST